jgi:Flp pilus assembly protein TadB
MSADAEDREREIAQDALHHSWDWFALHAAQRMQCVNFFLVAVAFLIAAFVTALTGKHYAVAVAVGLLGGWISWWFHRLELWTKELVKAGVAEVVGGGRDHRLSATIATRRVAFLVYVA